MNVMGFNITPVGLLKLIGFSLAIWAFVAGPLRSIRLKRKAAEGSPVVIQDRRSFLGWVGHTLMVQSIISVLTGLIGIPLIATIVCCLCGGVIWLCGGTFTMPSSVMAGPRATWAWFKSELTDVAKSARPEIDDKKEAAAKAYEEARKAAADSAHRIDEARRQAAEALAEKQREAARAAERIREMERSAAEKVREAKEAADARVREAKDLADKASSLTKAAGMLTSLPSIRLPGIGAKSPEQVALEREKFEHQKIEAEWRSYRQSEPLSKMTLRDYMAANRTELDRALQDNAYWEAEREAVKHAKWRMWNRGYDFR